MVWRLRRTRTGSRHGLGGVAVGLIVTLLVNVPIVARAQPLIQHVVIIDQENHSFDNVLGVFCRRVATGRIVRANGCRGALKGTISDGTIIPLGESPDIVPEVRHRNEDQTNAIDGGKMDGFNKIDGCRRLQSYACYVQYYPSQIPNTIALAKAYAISDQTFTFASVPSWGSHVVLATATLDGFKGNNPHRSTYTTKTGPGWGCDSFKDAPWGPKDLLVPSCIPDQNGNGPYRTSPVPYVPTIFDRLDAAGLSWRIYGGADVAQGVFKTGYGWTICPTFYECQSTAQSANLVGASDILTDAADGTLPAFSIVTPNGAHSQHNGYSMTLGDNWIGQVVSAIQNSKDWTSTAIFLTWDDCGCFYDHVPPPNGWGIRVPMIIISPYVKLGYTDHTAVSGAGFLAFTEHNFGLSPLSSADQDAYDYSNAFTTTLNAARVPMVHTPIPRWELAWIAAHPPAEGST